MAGKAGATGNHARRVAALEALLSPPDSRPNFATVCVYEAPEDRAATEAEFMQWHPGRPFVGVERVRAEAFIADFKRTLQPGALLLVLDLEMIKALFEAHRR